MTDAEIRTCVLATLQDIAPEVDTAALAPARPLREQVDLDSMDWLNFLIALHQRYGIEIPEADYAGLTTVDRIVAYIAARAG